MGANVGPMWCNLILRMYELLSPLPGVDDYMSSRFIDDLVCIHLVSFTPMVRAHLGHTEAGSDPRGHLGVTWGVYLCAGKPPLADIILSHPPDLTRCDSVIGLAIPAMSGHIQYRGAAS